MASPTCTEALAPLTTVIAVEAALVLPTLKVAGLLCHTTCGAASEAACATRRYTIIHRSLTFAANSTIPPSRDIVPNPIDLTGAKLDSASSHTHLLAIHVLASRLAAMAAALDDHSPDEIFCNSDVFDIDFHPTADIVALGTISGVVQVCVLLACLSVDGFAFGIVTSRAANETHMLHLLHS